jgi:hypothetical protein
MAVCSGEQKDEPALSGPIEMRNSRGSHYIRACAFARIVRSNSSHAVAVGPLTVRQGARSGVKKVCCNNERFSRDGRQTPDYRPTRSCSHDCVPLQNEGPLYVRRTLFAPIGASAKENSPKGVDDPSLALHNLVSLLLMQRRRTKRCRVVVVKAAQREADRSLKTNSR